MRRASRDTAARPNCRLGLKDPGRRNVPAVREETPQGPQATDHLIRQQQLEPGEELRFSLLDELMG